MLKVAVSGARELPAGDWRPRVEQVLRELGGGVLRVALARGADQSVGEAGLEAGWSLAALLPSDAPTYRTALIADGADLDRYDALIARASVVHPMAATRLGAEQYYALGQTLLDGIGAGDGPLDGPADVLIAVFDPARTDGGRGGSEDVVALAVERGIRVILVDPATGTIYDDGGLGDDLRAARAILNGEMAVVDAAAQGAKRGFVRGAYLLAAASVAATALGAVPLTVLSHPSLAVTLFLASCEVAVLLAAVAWVTRHRYTKGRDRWAESRTRAELLRREHFLFAARAGPYVAAGDRASSRGHRQDVLRRFLGSGRTASNDELITLAHDEVARIASGAPDREPVMVLWYRRARIESQRAYFERQRAQREHQAHRWHRVARASVVVSIAGVLVHVGALLWGTHAAEALGHLGVLAAICGPAAAAAAQMVTTMRADSVDARRFAATTRMLETFKRAPARQDFDPRLWIEHVESLLLSEQVAWRSAVLSRDLDVG